MRSKVRHDDAKEMVNTDVSKDAGDGRAEPAKDPAPQRAAQPEPAPGRATEPDTAKDPDTRSGQTETRRSRRPSAASAASAVRRVRTVVGQLVWLVCLLAAIVLAVGALLVVVKANPHNALVKAVMRLADIADVGVFDRTNGIKQFGGSNPVIKDALFNWGIGAVVWLVVGRILERIIRPR